MREFEYTFEDTGITVSYRKVPSTIQADAARMMLPKRPKPRVEIVEIAGQEVEEPQDQDPKYLAELKVWGQEVQSLYIHMVIDRSVTKIHADDWKDAVADYRQFIRKYADMAEVEEYPEDNLDDKVLYVERIAAGSEDSLAAFFNEVQAISSPTEEAIQTHIETFRANGSDGGNGAIVGESRNIQGEDQTVKGKVRGRARRNAGG